MLQNLFLILFSVTETILAPYDIDLDVSPSWTYNWCNKYPQWAAHGITHTNSIPRELNVKINNALHNPLTDRQYALLIVSKLLYYIELQVDRH